MNRCTSILAMIGLAGCAASRGSGLGLGPHGEVTLEDTLPAFHRELSGVTTRADLAFARYEASAAELLGAAGAEPDDPGDKQLLKLCAQPEALSAVVDGFESLAPSELNALVADFVAKLGGAPDAVAAFAVTRSPRAVFRGQRDRRPLLLFNARSLELAGSDARRAAFARELFRLFHASRVPDSRSLSPVAREAFRAGAASFAARQLVPQADEAALLGVDERALTKLHARESVIAKEMLAAFDSSRATEAARFFDPNVTDPLLPPGSGKFLADRLFQRIAAAEGSLDAPLTLAPTEFLRRARPALIELAGSH